MNRSFDNDRRSKNIKNEFAAARIRKARRKKLEAAVIGVEKKEMLFYIL